MLPEQSEIDAYNRPTYVLQGTETLNFSQVYIASGAKTKLQL